MPEGSDEKVFGIEKNYDFYVHIWIHTIFHLIKMNFKHHFHHL